MGIFKSTFIWILSILLVSILLSGCGSSSDSGDSGSDSNSTSLELTFAAASEQAILSSSTENSVSGPEMSASAINEVDGDLYRGELLAENLDNGEIQRFDWSIFFNTDTFAAESNKTIILTPGNYQFTMLFTKGDFQYAGSSAQEIVDGENAIALTIKPIIGETVTDVTIVERLADFKFQYSPSELSAAGFADPKMGVILNGENEMILALNPETGISDQYLNLPSGNHHLKLKIYDGAFQRGRSVIAQEDVVVVPGTPITMDLVALHGETSFEIVEEGGDATFSFKVPAEVVEEAGGTVDLQTVVSIVGTKNSLQESELTLLQDASGDYEAQVTYPGFQYEKVTVSMAFTEISTLEPLGSCSLVATLNTAAKTINCELILRKRAVISGSLLGTLGINVYDLSGFPVAGATIYQGEKILGVTGSGAFGTAGYLKVYLPEGEYDLTASSETHLGEKMVQINPLGIHNEEMILAEEINVCGPDVTCDESTRLMWQDNHDFSQIPQPAAAAFCANLELNGNDDWRLPTIAETVVIAKKMHIFKSYYYNSSYTYHKMRYWTSQSPYMVYYGPVVIGTFGSSWGDVILSPGDVAKNYEPATSPWGYRCVRAF